MNRPVGHAEETLPIGQPEKISIHADLDVVQARQKGRLLANRLGFPLTDAIVIATAISELARNILQYAKQGEILLKPSERDGRAGIAIVAQDHGPGITNISQAMEDGFSTSGSLGLGLPGVKRLMDEFSIASEPGRGTTISVKKWKR
ncbi:MAG: anti-sigma regulatory factor [Acidobacteria bacterium]|nr:anti-sigma regulatory factor [Acidobacteriota bacterium]